MTPKHKGSAPGTGGDTWEVSHKFPIPPLYKGWNPKKRAKNEVDRWWGWGSREKLARLAGISGSLLSFIIARKRRCEGNLARRLERGTEVILGLPRTIPAEVWVDNLYTIHPAFLGRPKRYEEFLDEQASRDQAVIDKEERAILTAMSIHGPDGVTNADLDLLIERRRRMHQAPRYVVKAVERQIRRDEAERLIVERMREQEAEALDDWAEEIAALALPQGPVAEVEPEKEEEDA